jgi:hypothetical protein
MLPKLSLALLLVGYKPKLPLPCTKPRQGVKLGLGADMATVANPGASAILAMKTSRRS